MNYFTTLNEINVNDKTEKKNNLTYLAWAWAWAEVKKLFPKSFYTIYENKDGWFYHTDGQTAWVKTGVTIVVENLVVESDGEYLTPVKTDNELIEHIEYLPVMDFKNKSIPIGNVTSFDVNKAIQRSLTKAVARHGLGLYIYAGEDLPEGEVEKKPKSEDKIKTSNGEMTEEELEAEMKLPCTEQMLIQLDNIIDNKVDGTLEIILKKYHKTDTAELTRGEWADSLERVKHAADKEKK